MLTKFDTENSKQYAAFCDYFRLGPGRSLNQLLTHYKEQENPPSKTYVTLKKWYDVFQWEQRILQHLEDEQKLLDELHKEELIKNMRRRFEIIEDMYQITQEITVDTEDVSVNQATGLYKTLLESINNVFNLGAPIKVAPTDPTGQKEYQSDIAELLKLADAVKRRPE